MSSVINELDNLLFEVEDVFSTSNKASRNSSVDVSPVQSFGRGVESFQDFKFEADNNPTTTYGGVEPKQPLVPRRPSFNRSFGGGTSTTAENRENSGLIGSNSTTTTSTSSSSSSSSTTSNNSNNGSSSGPSLGGQPSFRSGRSFHLSLANKPASAKIDDVGNGVDINNREIYNPEGFSTSSATTCKLSSSSANIFNSNTYYSDPHNEKQDQLTKTTVDSLLEEYSTASGFSGCGGKEREQESRSTNNYGQPFPSIGNGGGGATMNSSSKSSTPSTSTISNTRLSSITSGTPKTKCKICYLGGPGNLCTTVHATGYITPSSTSNKTNNFTKGEEERRGSSFGRAICHKLRCTNCDFTVARFPNVKWDENLVNYLFFRNNMPMYNKLQSGLIPTSDSDGIHSGGVNAAAYCCQCCWVNIFDDVDGSGQKKVNAIDGAGGTENSGGKLKWVCAGH